MMAVLNILAADGELYTLVSPFIDMYEGNIEWEKIFSLYLHAGHRAVCDWAYACWRDEMPEGRNLFESVLNADPQYRKAILRGLAIRWG